MNWGMKMTNPMPEKDNDAMLDDLFAVARAETVPPGDDLMRRIMADAMEQGAGAGMPAPVQQIPWLTSIKEMIGGWTAVGGLATATATGLWMGISPPAAVEDFTASYYLTVSADSNEATIDSLLGFDTLILEEDA